MEKAKMGNGKRAWSLAAAVALFVVLFSGCTSAKKQQELIYRQQGIGFMQEGRYEEAVLAFEQALGECGGRVGETEIDICYYKAAAQCAAGDVAGAIETCDALIGYNEEDAKAYYLRGCLHLQSAQVDQATEDFDAAVRLNASDYELYIEIYENLASCGNAEKGAEYLEQAFSVKGDSAQAHAFRGEIYFLQGQFENALQELKTALDAGDLTANLMLGETCEAMGDLTSAETYYQAYVESGEADSDALGRLAVLAMGREDYGTALTYLVQALGLEETPNKRELLRNEVVCMEYTGDFEGAWTAVQQYVTLYPDDLDAQREYIFLKNRQPRPETATALPAENGDTETETEPEETEQGEGA